MKPSIPGGVRDFGPAEMRKREYLLNTIRNCFELFGFLPIETPAMENKETLEGKYGEEGDKQLYKIRSNVNLRAKLEAEGKLSQEKRELLDGIYKGWLPGPSDKALRFDLTVPFARYVAMNRSTLTFPFKRYQIQPVWRGERQQKGRYREFWQCDADVIGSKSIISEIDFVSIIDTVFSRLGLPVVLKINNRKILAGIAEIVRAPEKLIDLSVAVDKIDKVGQDGVIKELAQRGFSEEQISKIKELLLLKAKKILFDLGALKESVFLSELNFLENGSEYRESKILLEGIAELKEIGKYLSQWKHIKIDFDPTLARGLNYYTGTIFEVKAAQGSLTSSILGGGRYDDLTAIFDLPGVSGVGISFGIDRIYDVLEELSLYPPSIGQVSSVKVLFTHFDELSRDYCMQAAAELREKNISCSVYPDITKIKKQFDFANRMNIPYVCTAGSQEMANHSFTMKNMTSGEQREMQTAILLEFFSKNE